MTRREVLDAKLGDEARQIGWLFPETERSNCFEGWQVMYTGITSGTVAWSALPA